MQTGNELNEVPTDKLTEAKMQAATLCQSVVQLGYLVGSMASVFLRKNGTKFLIKWAERLRDGSKKWHSDATSITDRDQALQLAQACEAAGRRVDRDPLPPPEPVVQDKASSPKTVADLMRWWLANFVSRRSFQPTSSRTDKHFLRDEIGRVRLVDLTPQAMNRYLHRKEHDEGLSASTCNHLRVSVSRAFTLAIEHGLWEGPNPMSGVKKKKSKKKGAHRDWLRPDEVGPFMQHVSQDWRVPCALALFMGLRKGEVFGLRRSDVDLTRRELTVAMSWDEELSKGGTVDVLPIPDVVLPHLQEAMHRSEGSSLLFPDRNGNMQRRDNDSAPEVKAACVRAGITRDLDFHSLRHSACSLLLSKGVPIHLVQRIMRHADVNVTNGVYAHVANDQLRDAANAISTFGSGVPSGVGPS